MVGNQKSNIWSKIQSLVRNQIAGQKSKFLTLKIEILTKTCFEQKLKLIEKNLVGCKKSILLFISSSKFTKHVVKKYIPKLTSKQKKIEKKKLFLIFDLKIMR